MVMEAVDFSTMSEEELEELEWESRMTGKSIQVLAQNKRNKQRSLGDY